jgi:hypothetical protein
MGYSSRITPIVVPSYEEHQETLALLKLLASGHHDIEQGRFRDAGVVFTDLEADDDV